MKRVYKANLFSLQIVLCMMFLPILATLVIEIIKLIYPISKGVEDLFITIISVWIPVYIYLKKCKNNNNYNIKEMLKINKVSFSNIIYAILIILCINPLIEVFAIASAAIFPKSAEFISSAIEYNLLFQIIHIVIIAGLEEEVIMRGIVLNGYKNIKSVHFVAIMNGIIFGLFHVNLYQFFYASIMGTIFAYVVIYTNSIFPAIIMHMMNNGISVIEMNTGKTLFNYDTSTDLLLLLLSAVVGLGLVVLMLKKLKKKNNWEERVLREQGYREKSYIEQEMPRTKKGIFKIYWPVMVLALMNIAMIPLYNILGNLE